MITLLGLTGTLCLSCMDQGPVQPRGRPVDVQVEQAIPDGCARFQIHANPGQTVTIDSIYGTQYCQTDELKLIQDSAAVFDAATGKLRVPIVVKNVGTRAVRGLLKLRYDADSVQLFDANGNPVAGPTTIVGLGDSTLNNGRVAYWAYNQLLAPAGQFQVLFSGQTSGRRWLELQGTDWNRTVKIKLFTTARYDVVPPVAPDTIPSWFEDDSNFVSHPALASLPFRRDAVIVYFNPNTSPTERASAIALVGGAVVGGQRVLGDGAYFVLLPPDSTNQRPFTASDALNALPAVAAAIVQIRFEGPGAWQKPIDGLAWQRTDYHVYAESAYVPHPYRSTWALDAIRAPLAWGCSTGDSLTRVAVVDQGFHYALMPDLTRNHGDTSGVDMNGFSWQHGTAVAMVLAARGNDSSQMAGVVWRAHLDLRESSQFVNGAPKYVHGKPAALNTDVLRMIELAAANNARVINLSLGRDTAASGIAPASLQSRYDQFSIAVRAVLRQAAPAHDPLFVVAAGNNIGADPVFSYFPVLRDSLPATTLVVTASSRDSGIAVFSPPGGSRVRPDVAAPGKDVPTYTQSGGASLTGTSFAAPLVSGIAALLFSFDSSLSASEVRDAIVQAATNRGRRAGSYPVVDAYEALRIVAQRPGAPVCGNRVFIKNGSQLTVERRLDDPTSDDVIGTWSTGWPVMYVEHGGKSISNGFMTGSNVHFVFNGTSWVQQVGSGDESKSPFLSALGGISHDRDTALFFVPVPVSNRTHIKYYLTDSLGNALNSTSVTVPLGAMNGAHMQTYDLSRPRAFFAPLADPAKPIFELDMAGGTYSTLPLNYSLTKVDWLGIAEDGSELRILDRDTQSGVCNIDFVSLRQADRGVRRRRIQGGIAANGSCAVDGTFAPRVVTPHTTIGSGAASGTTGAAHGPWKTP